MNIIAALTLTITSVALCTFVLTADPDEQENQQLVEAFEQVQNQQSEYLNKNDHYGELTDLRLADPSLDQLEEQIEIKLSEDGQGYITEIEDYSMSVVDEQVVARSCQGGDMCQDGQWQTEER